MRTEHNNRRSTSQVLPRIYMFLQISIMLLLSYIIFVILTGLGVPSKLLVVALVFANLFTLNKIFFKCKSILKRNNFMRKFS